MVGEVSFSCEVERVSGFRARALYVEPWWPQRLRKTTLKPTLLLKNCILSALNLFELNDKPAGYQLRA